MNFLSRLFGKTVERPSPSDIIPKANITVNTFYNAAQIRIDYTHLNIPFTKPPIIKPIMDIPDTNSMDGLMDYGHNPLYIEPSDIENHKILVDWLAAEFLRSKGLLANDCVYRVMVDDTDNSSDFTKPYKWYAIHRIWKIGYDENGRWWIFKGINNVVRDPVYARDNNILWVNTGIIY